VSQPGIDGHGNPLRRDLEKGLHNSAVHIVIHSSLQILVQIQQTAIQSQRALNVSLQQSASKDRERRILQLTIDEISQMKGDVNLYKGVGKMYIL
jgi:hypothetical protein